MLGFFERGQIIDLPVIYISRVTGQLIDPTDPTVEISHYESATEIIDLVETVLTKITTRPVGHYTYEFAIPITFAINEIYYVRWRGTEPTCGRTVVEETFKIVDPSTSSCCGLVPRFVKC